MLRRTFHIEGLGMEAFAVTNQWLENHPERHWCAKYRCHLLKSVCNIRKQRQECSCDVEMDEFEKDLSDLMSVIYG